MSFEYLLEIDVGYHLRRWKWTGTTGLYSHALTEIAPISVAVNGTTYSEAQSLALCGSAGGLATWFADRGSAIYVHEALNQDPTLKTVKIECTWHYSRRGVVVPKILGTGVGSAVHPVFFDSRMETVPGVSYRANPDALGGGIIPQIGQLVLQNNDGAFDNSLAGVIWKGQPARLYAGTPGGTLPSGYPLRQSFVVDAPMLTRSIMTIPVQGDFGRIRAAVNSGTTMSIISGNVSVVNPAPVVIGAFAGVPAYFNGSTGTVGTYQLAGHAVGTVTRVWNSAGTIGTINGNLSASGKVAAMPVSLMGKEAIFCAGTGMLSGGTALFKAGETMQHLLASVALVPAASIDTAAFGTLDAERAVNISAWWGRNETIEEALNQVSQTVFANWTVGRGGKFSARLIKLRPGNVFSNYDFDTVGTPSYGYLDPLEFHSLAYPTRLSSSKMLMYTDRLLKDGTAGVALYRGTGSSRSTKTSMSIRLPLDATEDPIYFGGLAQDTNNYFGMLLGQGTQPTQLLVMAENGTVATSHSFGGYPATSIAGSQVPVFCRVENITGAGTTYQIETSVSGRGTTITWERPGIAWNGFPFMGFTAAGTGLNVGTIGAKLFGGSDAIETPKSNKMTWWESLGGAHNFGTASRLAYDGNVMLVIKTPGGAGGTLAGAMYVGTSSVQLTAGTEYYYTLVAARQSGSATSFRLVANDAGGTTHLGDGIALGTGTWSRAVLSFAPGSSGTGTAGLYVDYGGTTAGTVWVDRVELYAVRPINSWQLGGFTARLVNPSSERVTIRYNGTGTVVSVPLDAERYDADARARYYVGTAQGATAALVYRGLENRVLPVLAYNSPDAAVIGSAVLDYYSRPRIHWEAEFLDAQETTLQLWDMLFIRDGRFPGMPEGHRLLYVSSIEDVHDRNGIPLTRIEGEFVFDAVDDLATIV